MYDLSNRKTIVYQSEKKIENNSGEYIVTKKSLQKPTYKL